MKPESRAVQRGWSGLQQARAFVKAKFPYFSSTVLGLSPFHVEGLKTLAVNPDLVMGVDIEWFGTLSVPVGAGCLIHESMHILRDIKRLSKFKNPKLANTAFDIAINNDLRRWGIELPPWAVYCTTFGLPDGLSGEKYYDLLETGGAQINDLHISFKGKTVRMGVTVGECGTCAQPHTNPDSWEIPLIPFNRTRSDAEYIRNEGLRSLRERVKAQGSLPGSLSELLEFEEYEEAVIPWQSMLRSSFGNAIGAARAGATEFSRHRPSKRSWSTGILRPGQIARDINVCFMRDTSGSMGKKELQAATATAIDLMRTLGIIEMWFIDADAAPTEPIRVRSADIMDIPIRGRGGTDFRPAIETAIKLKPQVMVYATDGWGTAPPHKPPGSEFIWLIVPGPQTRAPCKWGTHIILSDDPVARRRYWSQDK